MFDAKTIRLAESLRPDLDFSVMGTEQFAILKIVENATGGGVVPIYDADITNGIASFSGVTKSKPLVSLKLNIPVTQTGSGTPSPDNVRPIVGFTEANIVRCGINTWNGEYTPNTWISEISTGDTAPHNGTGVTDYIPIVGGTSYYKFDTGSSRASYFDMNKNCIGGGIPSEAGVITTPANAYYVRFTVADEKISSFGLNYPSTDTDYHAYNGNIYTFTFGQSIYQGSIDWKRGVVVVNMGVLNLGSLTYSYSDYGGAWLHPIFYSFVPLAKPTWLINSLCSIYGKAPSGEGVYNITNEKYIFSSNKYLYIRDDSYTSATDFKNAVNNQYLAYELATPIEIQLTPTQITTLIGENVIFADVGDITECKFTRK